MFCNLYFCVISCVSLLGGTSVSGALECPENEKRMIVSLDTSQMVGVEIHYGNNWVAGNKNMLKWNIIMVNK